MTLKTVVSGSSTPSSASSNFPRNTGIKRYEVSTSDTEKYEALIRPHIDFLTDEMSKLVSRGIGWQVKVTYVDEELPTARELRAAAKNRRAWERYGNYRQWRHRESEA
jgi:hypothetical protein